MTKLAATERSILFMNNMAGDDLWEQGHLLMGDCSESNPPHKLFKYKSTPKTAHNSKGIYLTHIPYIAENNTKINLYGFPFLSIDVDPFDIEYPTSPEGLIITQDMRMLDFLIEQDSSFRFSANPYSSKLAWAKNQNLPTVLAVHHAKKYRGNIKELNRLIGMETFCPVLWHTGGPNAEFFRNAIKLLLS